ncbi:hypothetical protein V8C42DRAFT_358119 [Trichoderma barbatum]
MASGNPSVPTSLRVAMPTPHTSQMMMQRNMNMNLNANGLAPQQSQNPVTAGAQSSSLVNGLHMNQNMGQNMGRNMGMGMMPSQQPRFIVATGSQNSCLINGNNMSTNANMNLPQQPPVAVATGPQTPSLVIGNNANTNMNLPQQPYAAVATGTQTPSMAMNIASRSTLRVPGAGAIPQTLRHVENPQSKALAPRHTTATRVVKRARVKAPSTSSANRNSSATMGGITPNMTTEAPPIQPDLRAAMEATIIDVTSPVARAAFPKFVPTNGSQSVSQGHQQPVQQPVQQQDEQTAQVDTVMDCAPIVAQAEIENAATYNGLKTTCMSGGHQQPVQKTGQKPAQKAAQKPAQKASQKPAQQPVQEPAQKSSEQPAQQPVQQPAQKASEQSAQQPVQQPAQKASEQPAQQPVQQPVANSAQQQDQNAIIIDSTPTVTQTEIENAAPSNVPQTTHQSPQQPTTEDDMPPVISPQQLDWLYADQHWLDEHHLSLHQLGLLAENKGGYGWVERARRILLGDGGFNVYDIDCSLYEFDEKAYTLTPIPRQAYEGVAGLFCEGCPSAKNAYDLAHTPIESLCQTAADDDFWSNYNNGDMELMPTEDVWDAFMKAQMDKNERVPSADE